MAVRLEDRFWSKVDQRGPDECWPWTAAIFQGRMGYGVFRLAGKNLYAHRVAYHLATGQDPAGKVVRHRCDNPPCCNPDHLEIGTTADNARDRVERGRQTKGEDVNTAKLTQEKVREIRRRAAAGESQKVLALEFGVRNTAVHKIVHRHTWKHVK